VLMVLVSTPHDDCTINAIASAIVVRIFTRNF
jgi:hypothetical protein